MVKKDSDLTNADELLEQASRLSKEYKAKVIWNFIYFIGVLATAVITAFLSLGKSKFSDITELTKEIPLDALLFGTLISFLTGTFSSYITNSRTNTKEKINIRNAITDTYLQRIENSRLNPKRRSI